MVDFYDLDIFKTKQLAILVEDIYDSQRLSRYLGVDVPDHGCIYTILHGYLTKHELSERKMLEEYGYVILRAA